ncbi:AAA family ATPase, partial [Citreimonas sp.]|uniref:AAA family ATPase n=1 Tax=Citreimonas sp. TaxID=3036715 RepID=UPI0035C805E2
MRLRRLDLVRYGRFTDHSLDFGDAGTATDVTLVYGENEAGKSTAFAAWLDLLFGLPLQHAYDFVHARRELLVAAALDTADGRLDLRRTGQRTGSLTDAAGRAIDESRLSRLLHGLDRDGYRTRFSLDDEVLRRGGEEIAQAKGELGQLLYAGATGLSGYAALLKEAEAEVDAFHKPRGRSTALAEAKTRLMEIGAALAEARLDPRRFEALRRDMDACDRACADADSLRDDARRALALRETADARRTLRREMQETEQTLATYPEGPDLPPDAPTQVRLAVEAAARAEAACAKAERRREAIADQLAGATPDAAGIEVGHMLETLEAARFDDGESLIARAVAAAADMARRTAERDEARADARRMAVVLAGAEADPAQLVLPKPVIAALREAAQDVRAAARSHADAALALAEAEADLGEPESMPDGADALADALDAFRALPFDLSDLARVADERATEARALAAGLPPGWRAMADAGLPAEAQIRAAERALTAANGRVEQAELRHREAVAARDARRAEHAAERQGAGVSDDTIAASRLDRDRLWAAHRAQLTAGTADAFEAAMREDDAQRDRHA